MMIDAFQRHKFLLLIVAAVCCQMPLYARIATISIKSQNDFDRLQESFNSVVDAGRNDVRIVFSRGEYVAKEGHFVLRGIDNPNLRVRVIGNGAVLRPEGHDYKDGDIYIGSFSVERCWMSGDNDLSIWSRMHVADGLVEVVDEVGKVCRIKSREQLPTKANYDNAYILIPQSYLSHVYKIKKVEGRHIYFVASNLAKRGNTWNVNHDYHYGRASIRYKTCNLDNENNHVRVVDGKVRLPKGILTAREGTTHRYIAVEDCSLKEFRISGLKIFGCRNVSGGAAIYFDKLMSKVCMIRDCVFDGFRSDVIRVLASQNVVVERNVFKDCYMNGVHADNMSVGVRVQGNVFENIGKAMMNTLCITCKGTDFEIRDNVLKDFGYGGIGAGVWYLAPKNNACTGVIEGNELYYSEEYIADKKEHCLMDAGAIYLWTKNDGVSIRNNYIHDIDGMCANRGIFCDDGAYNFEIVGNVIVRIHNSNCIDSRRVESVEDTKAPGSGINHSNVNITMKDNIVDGKILFVGSSSITDNNCFIGNYYVLCGNEVLLPTNDIRNVKHLGEAIKIQQIRNDGGKIVIPKEDIKHLKKIRNWKTLRKYVEVE